MLSMILILCINLKAQLIDGWYEPINSIAIEYNDSWVKFYYLATSDHAIQPEPNLYYHWYFKDQIHVTRGGFSGKPLHGEYTAWYNSNNLKEKGNFYYGLNDGTWMRWYENGMIKEVISWEKGTRNGIQRKYDYEGNLVKEMNYKKGQIHGYVFIYQKGEIVAKKKYKNGREIVRRTKRNDIKPAISDTSNVKI